MLTLDEDALRQLLMYLAIPDLLAMRQTCKQIEILTRDPQLWIHIRRRVATAPHIALPAYHKLVSALSGSEVEALVSHALRLTDTLYRPNPSGMNVIKAPSIPLHQPRSVTWVKFVRDQLVVVASSDAHKSSLTLWSIPELLQSERTMASLTECHLPWPVYRGASDSQSDGAVFALELRCR
ncbi:uncharacterized protein PHACADRAFT_169853 [Phanerochaete carnosa HHB-10118-sp]|uniref:F-box domain-containing protein n=1 Tax=Phanerochaete carnosa (strain HHB-10118-sp) TaxID=650164 RepID=K5W5Y8_PHACS|nr:uncharacterized protein PHACADRAFT_169853 [Phanerochaete carnosa HHB-10118-sp]EKM59318.1 hypothetical protein PHACADRAFT_169853 [Phanerochaete carnosa HHB-10118-sp]